MLVCFLVLRDLSIKGGKELSKKEKIEDAGYRGDNKDRRYKRGKEAQPAAYGRQEISRRWASIRGKKPSERNT